MEQLLSRALLITAMAVFACASSLSQEPRTSSTRVDENDVLIVYLSRTKNTQVLANIIREQVGGRLERIETKTRQLEVKRGALTPRVPVASTLAPELASCDGGLLERFLNPLACCYSDVAIRSQAGQLLQCLPKPFQLRAQGCTSFA